MPTMQPGWCQVTNSNGIIAILIGLPLPAVEKLKAGDRSVIPAGLLKPGGKLGVNPGIILSLESISWI